jgi:myo-inositol-1(or 4)-monophosphatase
VWDYAAASLILEEAGGRITDYAGNAVPLVGGSDVAASNGHLHAYLLDLLQAEN